MPAGTCFATPSTKIVRCEWTWNSVCSPAEQLIPSMVWPDAVVPGLASAAPDGTGTPSGPTGPAAGPA